MRWRITKRLFLANSLLLLLAVCHGNAQIPTEKPEGYVSDFAGVLRPAARQELEALCTELNQKAKAQLAIVTVKSLQGRPLEEFTIDLATRWGIGPKGSDRGVMLFLAIQDRRSRIEVGYGLEPIIPDGRAGSILREMTPYLRNGNYDGAVQLGASTIAQIIAQESGVTLTSLSAVRPPVQSPPRGETGSGVSWPSTFFWTLWFIFFFGPFFLLFLPRRWRRRLGMGSSGGGSSWGSGSSDGGGGGFGGFGGGSFGGGGASGSW